LRLLVAHAHRVAHVPGEEVRVRVRVRARASVEGAGLAGWPGGCSVLGKPPRVDVIPGDVGGAVLWDGHNGGDAGGPASRTVQADRALAIARLLKHDVEVAGAARVDVELY
jgi:hypothetical protein